METRVDFPNAKKKEFEDVYQKYWAEVYRIAMYYSGSHEGVSEEIAQDVFVKLLDCFDKVEESRMRKWLSVIARNMTINHMKKRAREYPKEDIELFSDLHVKEQCESAEESVFYKFLSDERRTHCYKILDKLYEENERWYEAIIKVYFLGMKQKNAADSIGITLDALTALLYRARKWIQRNYIYWD